MPDKIRWGILGCGRIARKFATDLKLVDDAILVAAGARSIESANAFAKDFPVAFTHGSYEELVQNENVDVIYIATPHSEHYKNTMLCLEHGKAVLCEKAFAVNSKQATEMVSKAREKKVFLMEALWSKFLPNYNKLQELLSQQKVGDIKIGSHQFRVCAAATCSPAYVRPGTGRRQFIRHWYLQCFYGNECVG